jgi:hypothetical protein
LRQWAIAPACAIAAVRSRCLRADPGYSRNQEEGRSCGAIRYRQLRPLTLRRTSRPAPFVRRGCELPLDLLDPRGAFTEPCRPLTFSWSPASTPESVSFVPPDALVRSSALLRDGNLETFDPRVRGLRTAVPVKARRPVVRERLPSCPRSHEPKLMNRYRVSD